MYGVVPKSLWNKLNPADENPNPDTPNRTIGSYWPYATTLYWYIQDSMPFPHPKTLTNSQTYAITAYLLAVNNIKIDGEELEDDFRTTGIIHIVVLSGANIMLVERECRVTHVSDKRHLRASHIKPWRDADNRERLDRNNGLLLSPHIDHLFDQGYITFSPSHQLLVVPEVRTNLLDKWGIDAARETMGLTWPNAARNMEHYFGVSGTPLEQNVGQMLTEIPVFQQTVDGAMRIRPRADTGVPGR